MNRCRHPSRASRAFTLLELLVSTAVLALLLVAMTQILSSSQSAWTRTRSMTEQHREARAAFEFIARRISQATLNAYWAYDDPTTPTKYQRASELHFVCGPSSLLLSTAAAGGNPPCGQAVFFLAPLGPSPSSTPATAASQENLDDVLNACGYFVEYGSDLAERPSFLAEDIASYPERKRFRLMEYRLPAENLDIFRLVDDPVPALSSAPAKMKMPWIESPGRPTPTLSDRETLYGWFRAGVQTSTSGSPRHVQPVAENILAIFLQPDSPTGSSTRDTTFDATDGIYDSRRHQWENSALANSTRHQLPPVLRLSLVALDEVSWSLLSTDVANDKAAKLLQTINGALFKRTADIDGDLVKLGRQLDEDKIKYRIFSTAIQIPAARMLSDKN